VLAITPFNFTAIAGNLPASCALMGNVVVWKPAETQVLAAHHTVRLFEAAGLPAGVINVVHGDGARVSEACLASPDLAGIHFTGSTRVFRLNDRSPSLKSSATVDAGCSKGTTTAFHAACCAVRYASPSVTSNPIAGA
jgi:acyl-CoA reductase-like NAD-dependent aldehyde dehydrogenase